MKSMFFLHIFIKCNISLHFSGDTASNLGNAMDELMRHQPSLRIDATKAIIRVCIIRRLNYIVLQLEYHILFK